MRITRPMWRPMSSPRLSALSALVWASACLPVDEPRPQCFPKEPCEGGLICVEGACVPPPTRQLTLNLSCVSAPSCLSALSEREETSEETSDETSDVVPACLILEQPHHVSAHPISLTDSASLSLEAPLSEGIVRASVVVLEGSECPTSVEALKARSLHLACLEESGCLLRLRHPQAQVSDALTLDFEGPLGQCVEVSWGTEAPAERCDGVDNDCDGFSDEGVSCP